ncbi:DUF6087 family protein [Streptomyces sp. NRRL S-495]|uniref:DUF6087 family protein n=1 Tax=Streptomyces sp. NRRL S-495 TaxID=1609133 RepID=UPI0006991E84|nr:DUF6087 family protein [Streptomyces sp. NRRL S-495]
MDAEEGPPADQPLAEWYAERARRRRAPGTRDAFTLAPGPRRAAHLFQDVPRLVVEWDGHAWQPVAVAENYAEAYPLIVRPGSEEAPGPESVPGPESAPGPVFPQADTPVPLLRKGTGRHRKPDR